MSPARRWHINNAWRCQGVVVWLHSIFFDNGISSSKSSKKMGLFMKRHRNRVAQVYAPTRSVRNSDTGWRDGHRTQSSAWAATNPSHRLQGRYALVAFDRFKPRAFLIVLDFVHTSAGRCYGRSSCCVVSLARATACAGFIADSVPVVRKAAFNPLTTILSEGQLSQGCGTYNRRQGTFFTH